MAIHLAALSWPLIFILRLRFPPGKHIGNINARQTNWISEHTRHDHKLLLRIAI